MVVAPGDDVHFGALRDREDRVLPAIRRCQSVDTVAVARVNFEELQNILLEKENVLTARKPLELRNGCRETNEELRYVFRKNASLFGDV